MLPHKKAHPHKIASASLHAKLRENRLAGAHIFREKLSFRYGRGRAPSLLRWHRDLMWSDLGIAYVTCHALPSTELNGTCALSAPAC